MMSYDLTNKVIIITGANSGIGKAASVQLAKLGATVVMACRSRERGAQAIENVRNEAQSIKVALIVVDMSSQDSILEFVDAFKQRYEPLDVLIHNAVNFDQRQKKPATWEQAFQQLANLAERERLALFVDEFTYLLEVDPAIAGQLQNLWDHLLSKRNLFLCLSGSHLGMMKREFLSYQAPLYGRASAQLHLQPFPFGSTRHFFPKYSAVDRVAIYAIFGGVPAYWERVDPSKSVSQNIKSQLLTPNNLLQAEPRLLLQDFVSEPHNYIAILNAIANGAHTVKEIVSGAGLPTGHVAKN